MPRNSSFFIDDDADELVHRYEKYLSGTDHGYFDVEEMERIVDYYLSYGRTKDSLQALEFGKKLHPSSSSLDVKRAKIYLTTGDISRAMRILTNLVESDLEIVYLKIEALAKLKRTQEALQLAKSILSSEENDVDTLAVDLAMVFMGQGDFESSIEILRIGEQFNPDNQELLYDLAFCLEQKTRLNEAVQIYKRVVALDPYSGEAWFNLGQVYFLLNQFENAKEAYDYALVINENDTLSMLQKAHSHYQLGQWSDAIEIYTEYADTVSDKWQIWLFIAECYEELEDFVNAMRYYLLSYEEVQDNYDALVGISVCLLEMELYQESLEYIGKALNINDEKADAWVYLGEAKIGINNFPEALKAYQRAISIDPNQPDVLLALANIHMDTANFKMGLFYYEQAYAFDATLEFIELFIAVASYYTEDYAKSSKFLSLAIHRNLDAEKYFKELCPDADKQFVMLARMSSDEEEHIT